LDFTFDELETLAHYVEMYDAPKGTKLFHQGDRDLYMALIWRGSVLILKDDSNGKQRGLATLYRNQTLGEMSIVDNQPRSASAVCLEDCQLLILSNEHMKIMHQKSPKLWGAILLQFCKMLSHRVRELSGEVIDFR
jgi:CRP-like cAMP-binding protein